MIRLGAYRPAETILHRLDPRVKILFVVATSLLIFAATPADVALISAFLAAAAGAARIRPVELLDALRPVTIFLAAIFLVHLLFTEGRPIVTLAPLPLQITSEGLRRGLYVTWQFAGLILAAALMTLSTSPSALVAGIERLLRPLSRIGVPSQDLAMMIAIALRFVPMLLMEYERLRMAQTARGADFTTGNLRLRARTVSMLAVLLMLAAFRRADELTVALEARGYRRGPRTSLRELCFSAADLVAAAAIASLLLASAAIGMTSSPLPGG